MESENFSLSENNYQSKPIQRPSRKLFFLRILFISCLLIFMMMAGMISLLRSEQFQFRSVQVFGVETFPVDQLELFTQEYISGMYLKVIPKSNTLLFSKTDFTNALKEQFPIIHTVYVSLDAPTIISIHVQEKTPIAVWCFTEHDCGFIDEKGIMYGRAPSFSEGVYPIFMSEKVTDFDIMYGKKIIAPEVMHRFIELQKTLESDDITLSTILLLDNGDISFSLEELFGQYPAERAHLLGTQDQDDAVFIRDMVTGLSHDVFKKQYINNPKSLEYIDLRFPGKIFYKFTDREIVLDEPQVVD
jgi:cell division septal protein FtsQ